jgi:predicted translin family RNA/ssDNA-binding protein
MAEGKAQRLREALDLEREILRQGRTLMAELRDDDPYRAVLERELSKLEEAISNVEQLAREFGQL